MRWIAFLALFLVVTGVARAAGPDDQYLDIYNEVLQADSLQEHGQSRGAAVKFLEAQKRLQKFKSDFPEWNPTVIGFRLQYLSEKMQALGSFLPAASAPAAPVAAGAPPTTSPNAGLEQQIAGLQEQVRALTTVRGELENKLKEALSVQPAAVSPVELAKREDEIVALKKEKDLLSVALDQAKAAGAAASQVSNSKLTADLAAAKLEASDANKKLEAVSSELASTKTAQATQTSPAEVAQIKQERDTLKEDLAARTKDLADLKAAAATQTPPAEVAQIKQERDTAKEELAARTKDLTDLKAAQANQTPPPEVAQITQERDSLKADLAARTKELADAEARGDQEVFAAHDQAKQALEQRDELQKKLDAAGAAPTGADTAETARLQALLAVLEAKAVPYTTEELAVLNPGPAKTPEAPANHPHVAHSAMDLPPGAGAMMKDAIRASMEHDFAQAEEKYQEILRQDENNVYVLTHLADAQFAEGHLDDCGKTVDRALALDPDDPASLYLLGILRYRQERLDDALNALSRSAQLNSTNAGTQNYLGCVLADKGLRPAAETALRKALELEPDYPDAHYNLAFIYATEKPPSPELARWHYKRAVDLGHATNPKLDAILAGEK